MKLLPDHLWHAPALVPVSQDIYLLYLYVQFILSQLVTFQTTARGAEFLWDGYGCHLIEVHVFSGHFGAISGPFGAN